MNISQFFTDQALALMVGPLLIVAGVLLRKKRGRMDYTFIVFGAALMIFGLFRLL